MFVVVCQTRDRFVLKRFHIGLKFSGNCLTRGIVLSTRQFYAGFLIQERESAGLFVAGISSRNQRARNGQENIRADDRAGLLPSRDDQLDLIASRGYFAMYCR